MKHFYNTNAFMYSFINIRMSVNPQYSIEYLETIVPKWESG